MTFISSLALVIWLTSHDVSYQLPNVIITLYKVCFYSFLCQILNSLSFVLIFERILKRIVTWGIWIKSWVTHRLTSPAEGRHRMWHEIKRMASTVLIVTSDLHMGGGTLRISLHNYAHTQAGIVGVRFGFLSQAKVSSGDWCWDVNIFLPSQSFPDFNSAGVCLHCRHGRTCTTITHLKLCLLPPSIYLLLSVLTVPP